jgi:hypothetical protein
MDRWIAEIWRDGRYPCGEVVCNNVDGGVMDRWRE